MAEVMTNEKLGDWLELEKDNWNGSPPFKPDIPELVSVHSYAMHEAKEAIEHQDYLEWKSGRGDWKHAAEEKKKILAKATSGDDTQTGIYCCWFDQQSGEPEYALYMDDADSIKIDMEQHGQPTDLQRTTLHMRLALNCKEYNRIYEDQGKSSMTADTKFEFVVGFSIVGGVLRRNSCANAVNKNLGDGKTLKPHIYHELAKILKANDFAFQLLD